MALSDVKFSDEDMKETVEPLMEVADALAEAIMDTAEVIRDQGTLSDVQQAWRNFALRVLQFAKEN